MLTCEVSFGSTRLRSASVSSPNVLSWVHQLVSAEKKLAAWHAVENGEHLEFDDTVIVMGDCRRGSSVTSAGNVIVLGRCGSSPGLMCNLEVLILIHGCRKRSCLRPCC